MEEAKTITLGEIQPGHQLFYSGVKAMAKDIQFFQKIKYPKAHFYYEDKPYYYYKLNHVGHFDKDFVGDLMVYEQDMPGRYQANRFNDEYLKEKGEVWVGIPRITPESLKLCMQRMRIDAEKLASQNCFVNYSYKSILGFADNAVEYRLHHKEVWRTGIPKGSTCSQAEAKLYQDNFGFFIHKFWYMWMPCELAMSANIELRKLKIN